MRVGLHVTPYNQLMRRARKEQGLSQAQLAEKLGLSINTVGLIERMRQQVSDERAFDISCILGYDDRDMFPLELRQEKLCMNAFDIEIEVECLDQLQAPDIAYLPDLDKALHQEELKLLFAELLADLRPKEQKILEMRFGLLDGHPYTLGETAKMYGVTRERIRQVEAKALRRLRHPLRTRKLREYLP